MLGVGEYEERKPGREEPLVGKESVEIEALFSGEEGVPD